MFAFFYISGFTLGALSDILLYSLALETNNCDLTEFALFLEGEGGRVGYLHFFGSFVHCFSHQILLDS